MDIDEKVDWNVAQALTMEIINLKQQANSHYIRGDLISWFFCLKTITLTAIASLSDGERQTLKKIENRINPILSKMQGSQKGFSSNAQYLVCRIEAGELIEQYNETLMDVLQNRGFLMGKKADISKIAGVD